MPPKRSSTGGSASSNASKKPKTEAQQSRVSTNFRSGKGPAAAAAAAAAAAGKKAPVSVEAAIKKEAPISSASAKDGPTLSVADPNYDAHYKEVKAMMGGKAPIHGEVNGLNRVDDILRLFDLTYKYGPASGLSRIDRWNRAEELGMDPPVEVKNILLTREGINQPRYREPFTHGTGV